MPVKIFIYLYNLGDRVKNLTVTVNTGADLTDQCFTSIKSCNAFLQLVRMTSVLFILQSKICFTLIAQLEF